MIKEIAWNNWDYFSNDIGIDWEKLEDPLIWPPKTIAIYKTILCLIEIVSLMLLMMGRDNA